MKTLTRSLASLACLATLCTGALAQATINEIRPDQTGTDNDEYFELAGVPGTSLTGLTYVCIGDGAMAAGSGVIEVVVSLAGQTIPSTGYFVCAESTFTIGTADFQPAGANPINFENTDNVTHLLVSGFTGADGNDLDTNNDGVLDITPWTAIIDSVAVLTGGASELVYSTTTVGPDGANAPGHAYRCVSGWQIGPFNPVGGRDTPRARNSCNLEGYCFGSVASCPCGNGGMGDRGCDNAQATGGVLLQAFNHTPDGLGGGTVVLTGTGFPPASQPAVLVLRNNSAQYEASFGDGLLCVNGTGITRLAARIAIDGFSQHSISHGAGAGTFFYQLWYRNNPMTFCSATDAFNTSNAMTLVW